LMINTASTVEIRSHEFLLTSNYHSKPMHLSSTLLVPNLLLGL
jgi:hypothetical protein